MNEYNTREDGRWTPLEGVQRYSEVEVRVQRGIGSTRYVRALRGYQVVTVKPGTGLRAIEGDIEDVLHLKGYEYVEASSIPWFILGVDSEWVLVPDRYLEDLDWVSIYNQLVEGEPVQGFTVESMPYPNGRWVHVLVDPDSQDRPDFSDWLRELVRYAFQYQQQYERPRGFDRSWILEPDGPVVQLNGPTYLTPGPLEGDYAIYYPVTPSRTQEPLMLMDLVIKELVVVMWHREHESAVSMMYLQHVILPMAWEDWRRGTRLRLIERDRYTQYQFHYLDRKTVIVISPNNSSLPEPTLEELLPSLRWAERVMEVKASATVLNDWVQTQLQHVYRP